MAEKERAPLNSKSPLVREMILQGISGVAIILGLSVWEGSGVTQNVLTIALMTSLYVVGYFQLFLAGYVIDNQPKGVRSSIVLAFIALSLNLLVDLVILTQGFDSRAWFFFFLAFLNLLLAGRLIKIKDEKK